MVSVFIFELTFLWAQMAVWLITQQTARINMQEHSDIYGKSLQLFTYKYETS